MTESIQQKVRNPGKHFLVYSKNHGREKCIFEQAEHKISCLMKTLSFQILLLTCLLVFSCKKSSNNNNGKAQLAYGDSIFYLKSNDYTISPLNGKAGTYEAFPGNLLIDNTTGTITVALKGKDGQSQTGLKYKITFRPSIGDFTDSAFITLSGINYLDAFHYVSQNDSIISPAYNANTSLLLPNGNYSISADNKLSINPVNGQINVNESIRRGFFDDPAHSSWKQTTIRYAINDQSNSVQNQLDVILYHYNSIAEVPTNVSNLMQAHQALSLGVNRLNIPATVGPIDNNLSSNLSLSKPRPPCIVIIGH
jgi:hypothetical protein